MGEVTMNRAVGAASFRQKPRFGATALEADLGGS